MERFSGQRNRFEIRIKVGSWEDNRLLNGRKDERPRDRSVGFPQHVRDPSNAGLAHADDAQFQGRWKLTPLLNGEPQCRFPVCLAQIDLHPEMCGLQSAQSVDFFFGEHLEIG